MLSISEMSQSFGLIAKWRVTPILKHSFKGNFVRIMGRLVVLSFTGEWSRHRLRAAKPRTYSKRDNLGESLSRVNDKEHKIKMRWRGRKLWARNVKGVVTESACIIELLKNIITT